MSRFDQFSDWVADQWSRGAWFSFCVLLIAAWFTQGVVGGLWTDDLWHLELNSPTTAMTFLGVFLLHNTQHRFERAQNARWVALLRHLDIEDPVSDDGQVVEPREA